MRLKEAIDKIKSGIVSNNMLVVAEGFELLTGEDLTDALLSNAMGDAKFEDGTPIPRTLDMTEMTPEQAYNVEKVMSEEPQEECEQRVEQAKAEVESQIVIAEADALEKIAAPPGQRETEFAMRSEGSPFKSKKPRPWKNDFDPNMTMDKPAGYDNIDDKKVPPVERVRRPHKLIAAPCTDCGLRKMVDPSIINPDTKQFNCGYFKIGERCPYDTAD